MMASSEFAAAMERSACRNRCDRSSEATANVNDCLQSVNREMDEEFHFSFVI
jgi:hypothetical protein